MKKLNLTLIPLILVLALFGCIQTKSEKIKKVTYYLETIDRVGSTASSRILNGIHGEIDDHFFVLDKSKVVVPINKFDDIDTNLLAPNKYEIHEFHDINSIADHNIPQNNSIKIQIILKPSQGGEDATIQILFFCRQGKVEWWQCQDFGHFLFPSQEHVEIGIKQFTPDELKKEISNLILKLTFQDLNSSKENN